MSKEIQGVLITVAKITTSALTPKIEHMEKAAELDGTTPWSKYGVTYTVLKALQTGADSLYKKHLK